MSRLDDCCSVARGCPIPIPGTVSLLALYQGVAALPAADETLAADQARFRERMQLRDGGRCRVRIQKIYLIGGRRYG